ncbi:hypothetical protein KAR48_14705 [bacterium]|nr:hypothetical protein [bacterium]
MTKKGSTRKNESNRNVNPEVQKLLQENHDKDHKILLNDISEVIYKKRWNFLKILALFSFIAVLAGYFGFDDLMKRTIGKKVDTLVQKGLTEEIEDRFANLDSLSSTYKGLIDSLNNQVRRTKDIRESQIEDLTLKLIELRKDADLQSDEQSNIGGFNRNWIYYAEKKVNNKYYGNFSLSVLESSHTFKGYRQPGMVYRGDMCKCEMIELKVRESYPIDYVKQKEVGKLHLYDQVKIIDKKHLLDKDGNDEIWLQINFIRAKGI